jgi:hypothetical protein
VANRRLSMGKIKEVLRLCWELKLSARQTARSVSAHGKVDRRAREPVAKTAVSVLA